MMSNIEKNREREKKILYSLDKLGYLTTSQLQKMHNLGGHRNSCRVLKNMEDCLSSFRDREKVYYLNKTGRERTGSTKIYKKLNNTTTVHYVMRNDFYIYMSPNKWNVEQPVTVGDVKIIPDAIYTKQMLNEERFFFLEVDNDQRMYKNQAKVKKYKEMRELGGFQKKYGHFPTIIWVTKFESRKKELMKMCNGMKAEVYTWEEIR